MSKIVCEGCGTASDDGDRGTLGEQTAASGFFPYFDVSNGLSVVWLCAPCDDEALQALKVLHVLFGGKVRDIGFQTKWKQIIEPPTDEKGVPR